MATLKKNYIVKKRNALNEMRVKNMTLQELRFLAIYLSKINKDDESSRCVRFSLDDFRALMELGRLDVSYIKKATDTLLSRVVSVPIENESGKYIGYNSFQLFKRCKVITADIENYIEIDAHDDALPYMFDYKNRYFTYRLSNALRVKSCNQLCMYEILKQYEKIGQRILSVEELKRQLGIDEKEYGERFNNFKKRVLDACQQALQEHTDIKFTYEPYGKRGKGGKILYIRFFIQKNDDYIDQMTLTEFIQQQKDIEDSELSDYDKKMLFLSDACNNEFSTSKITVLHDKMVECLPLEVVRDELKCYDYLMRKCHYMNMMEEKKKIPHRFNYLLSIIGKD